MASGNETRSFIQWQFASQNVQTQIKNGRYVSSESTLVLGGPAQLSQLLLAGAADARDLQASLIPIGILQNASFAQNRQVSRMFEIGSKRAYFVPGRLFANFNIQRILFYGPSLMRMLYGAAPVSEMGPGAGTPFEFDGQVATTVPDYSSLYGDTAAQKRLLSPAGFGETATSSNANRDFFINLASDMFNVPIGLCFVFKDPKGRPYGAAYLENCYLESHALGVDANNIVLAEAVTGQFEKVAPIQLVTRG